MLKNLMIILALVMFFTAPAMAGIESDYLKGNTKELPQKTFELTTKSKSYRAYGTRTAGGKNKAALAHRSKKQRRVARHNRAQQKKAIERFGTFNQ